MHTALIVLISIVIFVAIFVTICIQLDDKKHKELIEKHQKRLKDELAKPKSYVKVTTFDGEYLYTRKFDPRYTYRFMSAGGGYNFLQTSRDFAEEYVHTSYKDGYFEFGNKSIPIRLIKEVEILSEGV